MSPEIVNCIDGSFVVVRYAFVYWCGGQIAQVLRLRMASLSLFAGRDKTSSSELAAELGIKVNLHKPRICEESVPRDGYGNTCSVHVRRDVTLDFVSSLTWRCLVHARRDAISGFLFVFIWVGDRSLHALNPRVEMSTCCQMCRPVDRWNG